jgi:hypothetical protein
MLDGNSIYILDYVAKQMTTTFCTRQSGKANKVAMNTRVISCVLANRNTACSSMCYGDMV